MHQTKVVENKKKLALYGGFINNDDHGFICFDGFDFTPVYPEGKQTVCGARTIAQSFAQFIRAIPAYIHPHSALGGAWAGDFKRYVNCDYPPEDRPVHLSPIHEKYGIRATGIGGMNHLGPDMEIGLREGYAGLLEKVRRCAVLHAPASADFYAAEECVLLAILDYMRANAELAATRARETDDPWARQNYAQIEAQLRRLLTAPPQTFREACQFLAVFQSVDRTYFGGGALSQLDELLRPFYQRDRGQGVLTDEEAVWILASLFYNDTHYSQLGGQSPDGTRELTSELSFLILQAAHTLAIPYNLAVRVFEGSDDRLLRKAVACILEKGSGPSFSLSKGIEEGYARQGHPMALARMRAKVGCNWVALPGIEYPLQDVTRLNLAWPFVHAFREESEKDAPSLDALWAGFASHLRIMVDCIREGYDWHLDTVSRNRPELVLNLFCHGPIERGLNSAEGGVDIINLNVDGIALATVADSFAAIEQRVVREGRLSWQALRKALDEDFQGQEGVRLMLKNIPRFGDPHSLAQAWAARIRDLFVALVNEMPTPKHHIRVVPGLFSHGDIFVYGKGLPATPNGRHAGEPISHSAEPDPGFAQGLQSFSPSLKANAVASVQAGYGNSAPLHLDIDDGLVASAGGVDALCALIHTHNQMAGTLLNLNVVSAEQIRRAHEDPDAYPDLVVRVTGYSAFFSSLSKEYRQQVVDRYLARE